MRLSSSISVTCVAVLVTVAAAHPGGQQRDTTPAPTTRQVAVGTSALHGRIVDAVTGLPVAQARVIVSGMTTAGVARAMEQGNAPVGARGVGPSVSTSLTTVVANASRQALTDRDGQFLINHLPAGRFTVSVTHRSFLQGAYGQRKPGGQGRPVVLVDGQKLDVSMKMVRGGVVSGVVYDEVGAPVANGRVQVWRSMPTVSGPRMQQQNGASTDDRGVYRVYGLQPGEYVVSAQQPQVFENETALEEAALIERAVSSGAVQPATTGRPATVSLPLPQQRPGVPSNAGVLPTYAPSAASAEAAARLTVVGGDEHAAIDIHLRRMRASMITGTITNMPPASAGGSRVQIQLYAEPFTGNTNGTSVNPQGEFSLANLTAGTYTIVAMTMPTNAPPPPPGVAVAPPQQPRLSGRVTVVVPEDATVPVSLTLQPGRSISGTVTYDMTRQTTMPGGIMVRLQNSPGQPGMFGQLPTAQVDQAGRFTLTDVPPGRYTLSGSMPVKSVQYAGQEVLDTLLEVSGNDDINGVAVTFSDKFSMVTGQVTAAGDFDPSEYTILIVSTDPQHWQQGARRIVTTRANIAGRYTANVPPGSYFIGMVTELEFGAQYDPEFLKALQAASVSVTVVDGERVTRDLRAGG